MADLRKEVEDAANKEVQEGNFQSEFDGDSPKYAAVRLVLEKARPACVEARTWRPYIEFLDPQWHYEDGQMEHRAGAPV
jgi:hypothetical protein